MRLFFNKFSILLVTLFFLSGCGGSDIVMNYQLDECDLSTDQTITDSSDKGHDGMAKHDNGTLPLPSQDFGAVVCNNLQFTNRSYIETPDNKDLSPLNSKKKMTLISWFNSSSNNGTILSKLNEYKLFIENGNLKVTIWGKDGVQYTTIIKNSVPINAWHFSAIYAEITGRRTLSLNINGYYGDGSSNTLEPITDSHTPYNGYSNTQNNLFIGTNSNLNDFFTGFIDEIGISNFEIEENTRMYADLTEIYNNQKDHKDTEENGDPIARICPACVPITPPDINHSFDIWDSFRDIDDRNISTKVTTHNFNLTLAALDETAQNYQEFNGTVCASIGTQTQKSLFVDQNTSTLNFTIDKAIQDERVQISWKKNIDENCPLVSEDNNTLSSDNFAIRPKEFFIIPNATSIKAGANFNVSFVAGESETVPSTDYNESVNVSFDMNVSEQKPACQVGEFTPAITSSWGFSDGNGSITTKYNEVGRVAILITEKNKSCSSRYAGVDCDDANVSGSYNSDNDLSILEKTQTLAFQAYQFNVNIASSNFDVINGFTYLANDIDQMSAKVDINITAQDSEGNTTTNYNSSCYANDVNINYIYSEVDENLQNFNYRYNLNNSFSIKTAQTVNSTINDDVNNTYFSTDNNGSAIFTLEYNFDRSRSVAINPFDINITELNVTDATFTDTNATSLDSSSARFFFARVMTKDVITNESDVNVITEIEVYDNNSSSYTSNFKQNSLFWYRHENQTSNSDGNITEVIPRLNTTLGTGAFTINDIGNVSAGTIRIGISNATAGHFTIHEKTQPWLWYIHENFGNDYNDSDGSTCMQHPCFSYELKSSSSASSIESGNFKGSDFNGASQRDYTKKGIKVFR